MAKRERTPEQIQADKDRMAAMRAKRGQNKQPKQTSANNLITLTPEQLQELIRSLSQGQTTQAAPPAFSTQPEVGLDGSMSGTYVKYNPDASYYPDPRDLLMDEERLRRFNLPENYWMTWEVTSKPYQNAQKIWITEPTFVLGLYVYEFDDEGELTGRSVLIQTVYLNEDKGVAFEFARAQGLTPTNENMRLVMDEARYERIKNWLYGIFFPPKPVQRQDSVSVIGGQVVSVVSNPVSRDDAESRASNLKF